MANLELSLQKVHSTHLRFLKWSGNSSMFQKLLILFRYERSDIKALYLLSDRELADLGLARGKLQMTFGTSENTKSRLDHLKRGVHLNGGQWN